MALALIDLLWRHHPSAQQPSRRGPQSARSTDNVVLAAISMADRHGIESLRMRELADRLGMSTMSMYTYVGGREDLLAGLDDRHCDGRISAAQLRTGGLARQAAADG